MEMTCCKSLLKALSTLGKIQQRLYTLQCKIADIYMGKHRVFSIDFQ